MLIVLEEDCDPIAYVLAQTIQNLLTMPVITIVNTNSFFYLFSYRRLKYEIMFNDLGLSADF